MENQIQQLLMELMGAQPREVPRIQREVQKLRVIRTILKELTMSSMDPNLYKDMNLLNRMMATADLEGEEDAQRDTDMARATEALKARNISPESASRIARVLHSLVNRDKAEAIPDNEPELTLPPSSGKLH